MIEILFVAFAVVALLSGVGVVVGRSPVASLLFMVATLASLAGIFVLLDAHFLAAIQVLVYAGAIMVLFLFVIMLLNLGHEYQRDLRGGAWAIVSFTVTGLLAGLLVRQVWGTEAETLLAGLADPAGGSAGGSAGAAALQAALAEHGAVGVIARPLYTDFVVPFEITGILLLVAIVGALALAKKRV